MSRLARIVDVEHLGEHRLRLTFTDGLVRDLDFSEPAADSGRGLGTPLRPGVLRPGRRRPGVGTIAWPNGVDFDPDVLHGDHEPASGRRATVLEEYRLGPRT